MLSRGGRSVAHLKTQRRVKRRVYDGKVTDALTADETGETNIADFDVGGIAGPQDECSVEDRPNDGAVVGVGEVEGVGNCSGGGRGCWGCDYGVL